MIGCGFQTKQRYRFGWFSMKLKLVAGDSAGVVTAYYVSLRACIRYSICASLMSSSSMLFDSN